VHTMSLSNPKGKKFVWNEIQKELPVLISLQAEIHSWVGITA
jgi:hypothetical protein